MSYRDRFASFSVVPGLDTNPGGDEPIRNMVSFNMLAGAGGALAGLEISGLGAVRTGPVAGLQLAGLFNAAGRFSGVELAGVTNVITGGPSQGLSLSGAVDVVAGELSGGQLAGGLALARSVRGLQFAPVALIWDDLHGAQLGAVGLAGDVSGVQFAAVPVAFGEVRGLQWGAVSVVGGDLTGAQLGTINWATRLDGLALGVINLGAEGADGLPIGLINLYGDGRYEPTVWADESVPINVALKMGSRRTHSILGVGFLPEGERASMVVLAGIGGHLPLDDRLWLEIDLIGQSLLKDFSGADGLDLLNRVRASVGLQIFDWLAVYGGVSLNLLVSDQREHGGPAWARLWADRRGDTFLDLGLGLFAGLMF